MTETPVLDADFAERVTMLNTAAKQCAEATVRLADVYGEDRNTVLRAVIARLQDAIGKLA